VRPKADADYLWYGIKGAVSFGDFTVLPNLAKAFTNCIWRNLWQYMIQHDKRKVILCLKLKTFSFSSHISKSTFKFKVMHIQWIHTVFALGWETFDVRLLCEVIQRLPSSVARVQFGLFCCGWIWHISPTLHSSTSFLSCSLFLLPLRQFLLTCSEEEHVTPNGLQARRFNW